MKKNEVSTLDDIARECKVSASTVSRVLNNEQGISRDTRDRVLACAHRNRFTLQRRRKPVTRSLIELLIVVPDGVEVAHNPFYEVGELINAIGDAFDAVKKRIEITTYSAMEEAMGGDSLKVDGVICAFGDISAAAKGVLRARGVPYVFLNRTFPDENYISCNHFHGMLTLGTHLYDSGCRSIGYLGCETIPVNRDRFRGYCVAVAEHTQSFEGITQLGLASIDEVSPAVAQFFVERECDAVMCFNDNFAIRLIGEFRKLGIQVPGGIAVTGFDDSPLRRVFKPSLTTISLSTYEMGFFAARWILDNIYRKETRRLRLEVDGVFIEGETVPKKTSGAGDVRGKK
ncbi:MAG: LacI family transcriptional regulator [Spirochaetes bacterium]|nr:MAG: LacI family transcriptional regulator [Spirochaetota bacterium]